MKSFSSTRYTSGPTSISIGRKSGYFAGTVHMVIGVAPHSVDFSPSIGGSYQSNCFVMDITRQEAARFLKSLKGSLTIARYTDVCEYKQTR
jgi:hypothetical protein